MGEVQYGGDSGGGAVGAVDVVVGVLVVTVEVPDEVSTTPALASAAAPSATVGISTVSPVYTELSSESPL
jgi:hypothetical protein